MFIGQYQEAADILGTLNTVTMPLKSQMYKYKHSDIFK